MSQDFCFYHAADLHLDTPFIGLEQASPRVAEALREASLAAFDNLVQSAVSDQAAFVLLAGDLYDGAQRGLRAQFRILKGLQRLSAAKIRVFIVHGNHDPLDGWSGIRAWPEGVHIFDSSHVQAIPVHTDGVCLATVYGISYANSHTSENLARRYVRQEGAGFHIAVLHANVGGNAEHAAYAPCSLEDLRASGMDYWALGHIHTRQILLRAPWVVYPGNLQGRSPKPSERGAKGAFRVDVRGGVLQEPTFVPLDSVRFIGLELDASSLDDIGALRASLLERGEALSAEHAGRGLLIRASIQGRPAFHPDLLRPETLPGLLHELRESTEMHDPFLWWESLRDETRPLLDREALLARGDFIAELLREVDLLASSPEAVGDLLKDLERPLAQYLPAGTPSPDATKVLAEAEVLALDLLGT